MQFAAFNQRTFLTAPHMAAQPGDTPWQQMNTDIDSSEGPIRRGLENA